MSFGIDRVNTRTAIDTITHDDRYYHSFSHYFPKRRSIYHIVRRNRILPTLLLLLLVVSLVYFFVKDGGLHLNRKPRGGYRSVSDAFPRNGHSGRRKAFGRVGRTGRLALQSARVSNSVGNVERAWLPKLGGGKVANGNGRTEDALPPAFPHGAGYYEVQKLVQTTAKATIERLSNDDDVRMVPMLDGSPTSLRKRMEAGQSYKMRIYKSKGNLVGAEGGGMKLISGLGMTPLGVPMHLKQVLTEGDDSEKETLKLLPHNFGGEFNTVAPEWARIWFNVTYYPWLSDQECRLYKVELSKRRLPTVALASFPNSGNTWLRYLLEGATGIFTGSFYKDTILSLKGSYGEMFPVDSGRTTAVKTHGRFLAGHDGQTTLGHLKECDGKGILLIRNPFRAIFGHRHLDTGSHTGFASVDHFIGKGWDDYVTFKIRLWEEFYVTWLVDGKEVHVVKFEDLTEEQALEATLASIADFLNLPPIGADRLGCVKKHAEGSFHRKKCSNEGLRRSASDNTTVVLEDVFSSSHKELVNSAITRVVEVVRHHYHDESFSLEDYHSTVVNYC